MKRVMFVCIENSNRSQMAQAFARIHGGPEIEALSSGSRPSGKVNPRAIEAMRDVGYDLTSHKSQGIDEVAVGEFDAVVTMGCGDSCPHVPAKHRADWQIPDPRDMDKEEFAKVRDLIESKVKSLLAEI